MCLRRFQTVSQFSFYIRISAAVCQKRFSFVIITYMCQFRMSMGASKRPIMKIRIVAVYLPTASVIKVSAVCIKTVQCFRLFWFQFQILLFLLHSKTPYALQIRLLISRIFKCALFKQHGASCHHIPDVRHITVSLRNLKMIRPRRMHHIIVHSIQDFLNSFRSLHTRSFSEHQHCRYGIKHFNMVHHGLLPMRAVPINLRFQLIKQLILCPLCDLFHLFQTETFSKPCRILQNRSRL